MTSRVMALALGLLFASTGVPALAAGEKVVKSRKVGASVVSLLTRSGTIVSGTNDVVVSVSDSAGNPKAATVERLSIYMPAMGSMKEMKADARLQPARTPGVYTGTLEVEMKGPWKTTVVFKDESGRHQAVFTIVAR